MINTPIILERFVSDIQSISSLDELNKIFAACMREIGMRYFTYHIVRIAGVGNELPYFITTYPDKWVRHYVAEEYVKIDPLILFGPRRLIPFLWDEVAAPKHLKDRQRLTEN